MPPTSPPAHIRQPRRLFNQFHPRVARRPAVERQCTGASGSLRRAGDQAIGKIRLSRSKQPNRRCHRLCTLHDQHIEVKQSADRSCYRSPIHLLCAGQYPHSLQHACNSNPAWVLGSERLQHRARQRRLHGIVPKQESQQNIRVDPRHAASSSELRSASDLVAASSFTARL